MSSFCSFFSKKFQHICVSLYVNFNKSLINDVISFEQLGPNFVNGELRWSVNMLAYELVNGDNYS